MTYALAWKSEKEVFLAADSAITTKRSGFKAVLGKTSTTFGRENYIDGDATVTVEERVQKVFLRENVGLVCAGYFPLLHSVAKTFYSEIHKGKSPLEALEWSLGENLLSRDKDLQCAVGYYDGEPHILSYDSHGGDEIHTDTDLVQMGSMPENFKIRTEEWLKFKAESLTKYADFQLIRMLSLFQTYDLLNPALMSWGVGGVFSGIYIDSGGGHVQPDTLFIEYEGKKDKVVSICRRHDTLVIQSPTIGENRCFSTTFLPLGSEMLKAQTLKALLKAERLFSRLEYEYIVVLSHVNNSLHIIKMSRENRHQLIHLKHYTEAKDTALAIAFDSEFKKVLDGKESGLYLHNYMKPRLKVNFDAQKAKHVRYD